MVNASTSRLLSQFFVARHFMDTMRGLFRWARDPRGKQRSDRCSVRSIFGWYGGGMASLYTRSADRVRLAKEAIAKLNENENGTSMLLPDLKVRAPEPKH